MIIQQLGAKGWLRMNRLRVLAFALIALLLRVEIGTNDAMNRPAPIPAIDSSAAPESLLTYCAPPGNCETGTARDMLFFSAERRIPADVMSRLKASRKAWVAARAPYCDEPTRAGESALHRELQQDRCRELTYEHRIRALRGFAACAQHPDRPGDCWDDIQAALDANSRTDHPSRQPVP